MSDPTFHPLHTGDPHDDDAQIIDRFFEPNPNVDIEGAAPVVNPTARPDLPNRLMTGYLLINDNTWAPAQIMWGDVHRKDTVVRITSLTSVATDSVLLADEPNKLAMAGAAGRVFHTGVFNPSDYTGPLWVAPAANLSAPILVSYWSVTK